MAHGLLSPRRTHRSVARWWPWCARWWPHLLAFARDRDRFMLASTSKAEASFVSANPSSKEQKMTVYQRRMEFRHLIHRSQFESQPDRSKSTVSSVHLRQMIEVCWFQLQLLRHSRDILMFSKTKSTKTPNSGQLGNQKRISSRKQKAQRSQTQANWETKRE